MTDRNFEDVNLIMEEGLEEYYGEQEGEEVENFEGTEEVITPELVAQYSYANVQELIEKKQVLKDEQAELEQLVTEQLERLGITEDQGASKVMNQEGAPAFERSKYERTIQMLTTNTLDNTFYVNKKDINAQTVEVLEEMAANDPEFLAKALIYARNEGLLQLAPTLGLAVLSKAEDKQWFKKVFPQIITTPDNLRNFVKICKEKDIRQGFGGVATEAAKEWLGNLSEYQALKYSGDAKSKRSKNGEVENNFSLRDLIVMARPKPETEEMDERFRWLVRGSKEMDGINHNPQIKAFEDLKQAETDTDRVTAIKEGKLPWEVVIPAVPKMTPELWEALMGAMPYMALLRNLNNLSKNGVFKTDANVEYVVQRLTDAKAIEKAKILPFRFYEAYMAYTGQSNGDADYWDDEDTSEETYTPAADSRIAAALEEALELSFVNMPDLQGELAIASDVSGSMSSRINEKGKTTYKDICGVFTGALLKKATGRVHALPFEYDVVRADLSGQDRILETTKKINRLGGGGTALGAPIQRLLATKQKVDTFIGITDNEDWAYGHSYRTSGSFLKLWRDYLEQVNPDAQAFLLRIDPYREAVAPQDEPNVNFIYGWSDAVPTYIAQTLEKQKNQVEEVQSIEL